MLVPLAAALVLARCIAAYGMVKFYGVVFLGRPREPNLAYAKDPGRLERAALVWFALGCVVLGLFPVNVIALIDPVDAMLVGSTVGGRGGSWMLLAPVNADRSSYSPIVFLAVIFAVVMLTIQIVHRHYRGQTRKVPAWDCGYPLQTPRMQDTAEGFGQPIRQVFEPFFRIERTLHRRRRQAAIQGRARGSFMALALSSGGARRRRDGAADRRIQQGAFPYTSLTASARCSRCCFSSDDQNNVCAMTKR